MKLDLRTPIRFVPRIGPMLSQKLEKLGIFTVNDLLRHVPHRYNDFSLHSPIARVQPGETVTIQGTVENFRNIFTKTGKRLQHMVVRDESGRLDVMWFNQIYLVKTIHPGDIINLAGAVNWFGHKLAMISPEYEVGSSAA